MRLFTGTSPDPRLDNRWFLETHTDDPEIVHTVLGDGIAFAWKQDAEDIKIYFETFPDGTIADVMKYGRNSVILGLGVWGRLTRERGMHGMCFLFKDFSVLMPTRHIAVRSLFELKNNEQKIAEMVEALGWEGGIGDTGTYPGLA